MEKETWRDIFCRQLATGGYWKFLHKEEFDSHQFLDRSDAFHIIKKAQAEVYVDIISKLNNRIDDSILKEIIEDYENHWKNSSDDSALGMFLNDKQIK